MDRLSRLSNLLADGRLGVNLIAVHGVITLTVLVSLMLRRVVIRGGDRLTHWPGLAWLEAAGEEAVRKTRALLFWTTALLILMTAVAGLVYHLAGRDIRADAIAWYEHLTAADLFEVAAAATGVVVLLVAGWVAVHIARRLRRALERHVNVKLEGISNEEAVRRWFLLLQFYATAIIRLTTAWGICHVVGAGVPADRIIGFLTRVITILVLARLLTLSFHVVTRLAADLGERYVGNGHLRLYWERVARLFPFGEKCFEAAVYVSAASLCVRQLRFIAFVADYGTSVVQCIGIFFVTRVLIELSQVLIGEAFGVYNEDRPVDQKSRTLVPLLGSISQYVLYFGSALFMLNALGINTAPILAGVGILGLAVGLGAQSLVTDIVSGFFILFENQYLVGDFVQIGDACGIVEAVGIRVTHVRDGQGKLYIIPNGQIKGVVSYSKGYVNAIVDLKVSTGTDLESVFRAMSEAGRRLRLAHPEVLTETQVHGLTELGTSDMTIRAVTKVRPGTHLAMQNHYRRLLKQVLDQNAMKPAMLAA